MRYLLTATLVVFLQSCKEGPSGPPGTDGSSDKQIRVLFPSASLGSSDTAGFISPIYTYIVKFNKNYYVDVDSIKFAAFVRSSNSNTTCRLEVFNLTDSNVVSGSLITTNNTSYVLEESQNALSSFPNKEITLALKIRSSTQGTFVECQQAGIYLYRK